jgi:hypothetical protein
MNLQTCHLSQLLALTSFKKFERKLHNYQQIVKLLIPKLKKLSFVNPPLMRGEKVVLKSKSHITNFQTYVKKIFKRCYKN